MSTNEWETILQADQHRLDLRAPCTDDDLGTAANALGHPLPMPLVGFYRYTNGFEDAGGQWETAWSLQRLVVENPARRQLDQLPLQLLGFGDDGAGGWFCLQSDGRDPAVSYFGWIDMQQRRIADDLRASWERWLEGGITV